MSRDDNVQVGTEQGQITYICFLSCSCQDSLSRHSQSSLGNLWWPHGVAAGPAKESDLHTQLLGGQEGLSWAPAQVGSILGWLLRHTSPVWLPAPGAASSPPCALPRKKHWNKKLGASKSFLPRSHTRMRALTPTFHIHLHLSRGAAVSVESGESSPQKCSCKGHWLSAGTATRKASGRGADLPRKADGAWLGPLWNVYKTQISRCFQLPHPQMVMKKESECPEQLRHWK